MWHVQESCSYNSISSKTWKWLSKYVWRGFRWLQDVVFTDIWQHKFEWKEFFRQQYWLFRQHLQLCRLNSLMDTLRKVMTFSTYMMSVNAWRNIWRKGTWDKYLQDFRYLLRSVRGGASANPYKKSLTRTPLHHKRYEALIFKGN